MGDSISSDESVFGLAVAMIVLTGLAVCLRFLSRATTKTSYAADDWWVGIGLLFFYTLMGLIISNALSAERGSPPASETTLKIYYAAGPMSVSATAAAKVSILCLYRRIFITGSFQRSSMVVSLLLFIYWITSVLGGLLACVPIQAVFQTDLPVTCINTRAFTLGLELLNCLLDIAILALPLKQIRKLQLTTRRKVQLSIIFSLGGLTTVAGIARIIVVYLPSSTSDVGAGNMIVVTIENSLGIICACLPTYGPLLTKAQAIALSLNTWYTDSGGRDRTQSEQREGSQNVQAGDKPARKLYNQIEDGALDNLYLTEAIRGSAVEHEDVSGRDIALDTFKVKDAAEAV